MNPHRTLDMVVPDGIDDPARPSGGNLYDLRLCRDLSALGWSVRMRPVTGGWPLADEPARRALERALTSVPDDSLVMVDGLVASGCPEVMVPASRRLRMVLLMHTPFGHPDAPSGPVEGEREVVGAAAAVVTTSEWTRRWLVASYEVDPARVHVAPPGVDAAEPATGSDGGGELLCVGAVTPGKGHDLLLAALARIADLDWRCVCVGSLDRAPEFVDALRRDIRCGDLDGRVVLAGPRTGVQLEASYADADVLVLASRAETYGMVVTEALARALPVVAPEVGGVPEALGSTPDGRLPGVLVRPADVAALADSLRRWLCDPGARQGLREAANRRRTALSGWSETTDRVVGVLAEVAR